MWHTYGFREMWVFCHSHSTLSVPITIWKWNNIFSFFSVRRIFYEDNCLGIFGKSKLSGSYGKSFIDKQSWWTWNLNYEFSEPPFSRKCYSVEDWCIVQHKLCIDVHLVMYMENANSTCHHCCKFVSLCGVFAFTIITYELHENMRQPC